MDHTVTVVCDGNGTVSPTGPLIVKHGDNVTFRFTPKPGNVLEKVLVGTIDVTAEAVPQNSYLLSDIQSDVTLTVTFSGAQSAIENVDRAYVKANKNKSGFVLVDVRPKEYFDGKSFTPGTVAGGHIAGAINVPLAVIQESTVAGLTALGLGTDKTVILYCNTGKTSGTAANELAAKGYGNLKNYLGSMNDWGSDPAETVVIAGLDLALGGEDAGVVSLDVPAGTGVRWSITSGAGVVELDSSTANPVGVLALGAGNAVLTATVDGIAKSECFVTVAGTGSGGSGCDLGFAPAAVLLLIPLMLLRK